jgi:hypothetical protein
MVRPSFSWQSYNRLSDGLTALEYHEYDGTVRQIYKQIDTSENDRIAWDAGLSATHRIRIVKPGRTLVTSLNGNVGDNSGVFLPRQFTFRPPNDNLDDLMSADEKNILKRVTDSRNYSLGGSLTYTEPISERSSLNLEYNTSYRYSDSDVRTYRWIESSGLENILFEDEYDAILSNISNSGYLTNRVQPGYRFNNDKINFNVNVSYESALLMNTQEVPVRPEPEQRYSFDNILYSTNLRYNIDKANTLNIRINSSTRNPSISDLQDVVDLTNTQNIRTGNSALDPSYTHRFSVRYNNSNSDKGMTIGANVGGQLQDNYIANHVITTAGYEVPNSGGYILREGERFTRPENMDGQWNVNAGVDFGLPLRFLKSNFNVNVRGDYSETPSKVDNIVTNTASRSARASATLGSNISENIDFLFSYDCRYEVSDFTALDAVREGADRNKMLRQGASGSLKWVFWKGLTFSANATYNNVYRPTQDTRESFLVCNALLGKKIFKSQRGELSVTANDIFNQNKAFTTSVNNNTVTKNRDIQIRRYFGVQFIYNLRMFGRGASRNSSDYNGLDQNTGSSFRGRGGMGGFTPGGAGGFGGMGGGGF